MKRLQQEVETLFPEESNDEEVQAEDDE
jgi:hypothetical protein